MMDVAGYSRLTEADVVGTHDRFRAIMLDIVEPSVAAAAGRIVRGTGDGAVIELPSATDAMRVAMQIQERIGAFEAGQPAEQAIKIRIGINLGDIIVDGNDIYGDGVNIAARLEALGRPGDIIVSESAMQTADGNLCKFTDLGIHRLKNINRPVRAYRVLPVGAPMASDSPDPFLNLHRDPHCVRGARQFDHGAVARSAHDPARGGADRRLHDVEHDGAKPVMGADDIGLRQTAIAGDVHHENGCETSLILRHRGGSYTRNVHTQMPARFNPLGPEGHFTDVIAFRFCDQACSAEPGSTGRALP